MYGLTNVPARLTNANAVAAGAIHNLELSYDGEIVAWGDNSASQTNVPPGLTSVISIAAAGFYANKGGHNIALRDDGTVVTWGDQTNSPPSLSDVVAIAAGATHSLGLMSNGTVVGWGYNNFGQSTGGSSSSGWTNGLVEFNGNPISNAVAIAAGGSHNLVLRSDGTVFGWGWDYYGQATGVPSSTLYGSNGVVTLLGQVLSNVVAIAAGANHSLALRSDATVVAWGDNSFGQTTVPADLSNVVAIALGGSESMDHCLALKADGTIAAWGKNNKGQTNVPVGLSNVLAVSAGSVHSLALVGSGPPLLQAPIADLSWNTNGFNLLLPTQSGRVYRLEYKDSLSDANWTALPLVSGNGGMLTLTDRTATNSQRFYRVRRW